MAEPNYSIYKYSVPLSDLRDVTKVAMPVDARVLSVDNQDGKLCVWAVVRTDKLVDNSFKLTYRYFRTAGTGHPLSAGLAQDKTGTFLGTVLFDGGGFVLHVWELTT